MKLFIFFLFFQQVVMSAESRDFESDAKKLSMALKSSLLTQVTEVIAKKGVLEAITFCHANVKSLAKKAGEDFEERFTFGRTSLLVRNPKNVPEAWMKPYLEEFSKTKEGNKSGVTHKLEDGKRVYLDPIYMRPVCLQCHGENVSTKTKEKIQSLYPSDKATGYRLGEFRGFVWVKEK